MHSDNSGIWAGDIPYSWTIYPKSPSQTHLPLSSSLGLFLELLSVVFTFFMFARIVIIVIIIVTVVSIVRNTSMMIIIIILVINIVIIITT